MISVEYWANRVARNCTARQWPDGLLQSARLKAHPRSLSASRESTSRRSPSFGLGQFRGSSAARWRSDFTSVTMESAVTSQWKILIPATCCPLTRRQIQSTKLGYRSDIATKLSRISTLAARRISQSRIYLRRHDFYLLIHRGTMNLSRIRVLDNVVDNVRSDRTLFDSDQNSVGILPSGCTPFTRREFDEALRRELVPP